LHGRGRGGTLGPVIEDTTKDSRRLAPDSAPLRGKVALVTGGASGLGLSHALMLAAAGADIAICDLGSQSASADVAYPLSDGTALEAAAGAVAAVGRRALAVEADVRDEQQLESAVTRTVEDLGRLDILVANAGISLWEQTWKTTRAQWDQLLEINLTGVWQSCKAAIPAMQAAGGGRIVLISSVAGVKASPGFGAYAAAKAGVISIGRSLARELAEFGITVNVVCPSTVDAGASRGAAASGGLEWDDFRRRMESRQVIKELVRPEDISRAVLFFSTDEARLMTGVVLPVDAGQSIV
jgi:NAD(P)-dependent dehydrogenase (short-subunit alcohol dehydrogenase family)